MMMQQVLALQEKLIAAFGPSNPYVEPQNLYNSIEKLVEAAGLKSPELYFTEPDPEQVKQQIAQAAQQPSPEEMKAQAQMQLEQMKAQANLELKRAELEFMKQIEAMKLEMEGKRKAMDMEVQRNKERAQAEADIAVKQADSAARAVSEDKKLALEAKIHEDNLKLEYLKNGITADPGMLDKLNSDIASMGEAIRILSAVVAQPPKKKRFNVIRDPETGDMLGAEEAPDEPVMH